MNCFSLFFSHEYQRIPVDVARSVQALAQFAAMHERKDHSRVLLVIRKDWHARRCYLEALKESDLSLWDRVRQFFGSRAFLLANVKRVVERSLMEVRGSLSSQEERATLENARAILNKKLFRKYRDHAPQHIIKAFFSQEERGEIRALQTMTRGGFQNCGASCYLASVFQALFSSPTFMQYVHERVEHSPTASLLEEVFGEMKRGVSIPHETTKAIVRKCLGHGWLAERPPEVHYDQQDSYSFLSFLFSHLIPLEEERRFYTVKKDKMLPWNDWLLTLPLHRAKIPGMSLQSLMDDPSFRMKRVSMPPPPLLAITVDGRAKLEGKKDRRAISAPSTLTIPRRDHEEIREVYRLSTVILFEGETLLGGHYYTYEPLYNEKRELIAWKTYNDQRVRLYHDSQEVRKISEQISQEGYMFFYSHFPS